MNLTASQRLEESVADGSRGTVRIEGLTNFLRTEYRRFLGIYINGARDESDALFNFWK